MPSDESLLAEIIHEARQWDERDDWKEYFDSPTEYRYAGAILRLHEMVRQRDEELMRLRATDTDRVRGEGAMIAAKHEMREIARLIASVNDLSVSELRALNERFESARIAYKRAADTDRVRGEGADND